MKLMILLLIVVRKVYGAEDEFEQKIVKPQPSWSTLRQNVRSLFTPILPKALKVVSNANVSAKCERSLIAFGLSFLKMKSWAIQMIDASSKIPGGILTGTTIDFGSFTECLKVRVNESSRGSQTPKEFFRGRFCTVGFEPTFLLSQKQNLTVNEIPEIVKNLIGKFNLAERPALWLGVCLPSSCSEDDVQRLSTTISGSFYSKSYVAECHTEERMVWPSSSIAAICVLCCLIFLCIFGSIFDVFSRHQIRDLKASKENKKKSFFEALKLFSVLENTKELFKIRSTNDISCFHGIRILTALYVILGHMYFFLDALEIPKYTSLFNAYHLFENVSPAVIIEQFSLSVNTFFLMSGFLLVKTTVKQLEKNGGKLNIFQVIIRKYWRMTPALTLSLIILFTLPVLDSAPFWNSSLNPLLEKCKRYWWANFLYINNWLEVEDQCYSSSWFLAALMQMHIVGVCIIIAIYKWNYLGISLGGLIALSCNAAVAILVMWQNTSIPILKNYKERNAITDYARYYYVTTYFHLTSYLIGMAVAYIVEKKGEKKIPQRYQLLGWFLALLLAVFCFLSPYVPTDSKIYAAFLISVQRTLWSMSVGWLIYACLSGFGGIVNRLLSLKMMQPLGKLSFLIFMLHPLVIIYMDASSKERSYFGHTSKIFSFFGTAAVTLVIAYAGYVIVEAPFGKLERMVLRRQKE